MISALSAAEAEGADLAVFPELMLPGYPPEDLLVKPSFVQGNLEALSRVAAASRGCAAVVGFVDEEGALYNAAAVVAGGKVHGVWHKELLPNYGVFDERRWFRPGSGQDQLYMVNGVRTGVVVCEDAWSATGPIARLGAGGAELVVVINGSPYRDGVLRERRRMLATRAADASVVLVYVNLVGGQDELVFDGGSMVFGSDGELIAAAPQFEETTTFVDLELRPSYRKRDPRPEGLRRRDGVSCRPCHRGAAFRPPADPEAPFAGGGARPRSGGGGLPGARARHARLRREELLLRRARGAIRGCRLVARGDDRRPTPSGRAASTASCCRPATPRPARSTTPPPLLPTSASRLGPSGSSLLTPPSWSCSRTSSPGARAASSRRTCRRGSGASS